MTLKAVRSAGVHATAAELIGLVINRHDGRVKRQQGWMFCLQACSDLVGLNSKNQSLE